MVGEMWCLRVSTFVVGEVDKDEISSGVRPRLSEFLKYKSVVLFGPKKYF